MLIEDDNSKSDSMRLVQERIENVLFRIVISDPNANWNSLVTYISSCNEQHDTCKRLIRTILSLVSNIYLYLQIFSFIIIIIIIIIIIRTTLSKSKTSAKSYLKEWSLLILLNFLTYGKNSV